MMKKFVLIWCLILVFALTACGGSKPDEPVRSQENGKQESQVIVTEKETEPVDEELDESIPKDLPIYPGSELTLAMPAVYNGMVWWFDSPGSGQEIFDFFTSELKKAGLEICEESTGVEGFWFEIHPVDGVVTVMNNESETISDEVTPDTYGRSYIMAVDFDKWNAR